MSQSGSAQDSFAVCLRHTQPFFTAAVVLPSRRHSPNAPCLEEHNPRACALVEQPSTEHGLPPCFAQSCPLRLAMLGQPSTMHTFFFFSHPTFFSFPPDNCNRALSPLRICPRCRQCRTLHPPCQESARESLLLQTASPATALLPSHQLSSLPIHFLEVRTEVDTHRRNQVKLTAAAPSTRCTLPWQAGDALLATARNKESGLPTASERTFANQPFAGRSMSVGG